MTSNNLKKMMTKAILNFNDIEVEKVHFTNLSIQLI